MKEQSQKITAGGQILMDHVRELRTRILICAVVLVVGGIVGYIFYEPILLWLRSPLGTNLYYSTPAGSFNFIIKVASMVGVLVAIPFLVYQLIMFVQPAFKERLSRTRVVYYSIASIFLAIVGALFAFYVILPGALKFFAGFQVAGLSALIDANNYLNFVTNAITTFIIVFQIPLLMVIIDRIKPIPPKKLLKMEKWVLLGGLTASLFVPFALDITTCILIASPIVILYNVSVVMIVVRHFVGRTAKIRVAAQESQTVQEITLDDELVTDFFSKKSQVVPEIFLVPIAESIPSSFFNTQPPVDGLALQKYPVKQSRDVKPGQAVDVKALHALARAQREEKIAQRIALYNSPSFRIISDMR